jgi:benzoyl-CoA reductase/2-hydroxyglutaryl-CoA dehydratase subunit BcrC/BadD/HgdB
MKIYTIIMNLVKTTYIGMIEQENISSVLKYKQKWIKKIWYIWLKIWTKYIQLYWTIFIYILRRMKYIQIVAFSYQVFGVVYLRLRICWPYKMKESKIETIYLKHLQLIYLYSLIYSYSPIYSQPKYDEHVNYTITT